MESNATFPDVGEIGELRTGGIDAAFCFDNIRMRILTFHINNKVDESTYEGDTMDTIYRGLGPWELKHVPAIEPSSRHAVLYRLNPRTCPNELLQPFCSPPKWDALHVRLPCSQRNQYPVSNFDGTETIKNRWELICDTLDRSILTSHELEAAILTYNTKYARIWQFRALHQLCAELSHDGRAYFFDVTLPGIVRLALQLPELVCAPIPLLRSKRNASVSMTQQQIASLLANAFLCTFPRRNTQKRGSEYRTYPDINFNRLYQTADAAVLEKLKCLLHYFERVTTVAGTGVVTIARRCGGDADGDCGASIRSPRWHECAATFVGQRLRCTSSGTIEDDAGGLLQMDFANKYLGGGVLGRGCVQEEIRFVICPELMVTKLIAEVLQPTEALFVIGCERFSVYTGYAATFQFGGTFADQTPLDEWRRRCSTIVAIDALNFVRTEDQYREELMQRELDKAYVGWAPWLATPAPAIATGNWGCGAFGGDKRLKALLQLIVCAVVRRPLLYFTFGDVELRREVLQMWHWLRSEVVSVAKLWSYLVQFREHRLPGSGLYSFIYEKHRQSNRKSASVDSPEVTARAHENQKLPPIGTNVTIDSQLCSLDNDGNNQNVDEVPLSGETTTCIADIVPVCCQSIRNGDETIRTSTSGTPDEINESSAQQAEKVRVRQSTIDSFFTSTKRLD